MLHLLHSVKVICDAAVTPKAERPTVIPAAYPELEAEAYRAGELEGDRQTELPPVFTAGVFIAASGVCMTVLGAAVGL